ncbi:hypothetical protein [Cellulomonas soli]|uniref:Uncharacterized protein n=1 Tax=Cellulomonas soli TaxID=931535 RepID=A0A512P951_9CELL|nr:hypothetical protein [Cellulomonas soli]NYI57948.1 hypothetical protein [Cellulomonas soli]GEP67731.1 hypothetical protein CSO01_04460 [Cellulomonas soli]
MSAPGTGVPRRRRSRAGLAVGLAVVVALVVAGVFGLTRFGRSSVATCGRTAAAPVGGVVRTVAQGAQLVAGDVTLGVGSDLSEDGCAVSVFGAVEQLEVGALTDVGGTPVMLLSVEPRRAGSEAVGGAFEATFWVGTQG